jgi:hypothetical protein
MHLAFDIFQGIGIAAAVGIRPFLPALVAGALAAAGAEIHFNGTDYSFLQSAPFLLAMGVLALALGVFEARRPQQTERGPLVLVLAGAAIVLGALFFAASLSRGHYAVWPGYLGGALCAMVGILATRPLFARVRERLDAAAARAVPLYAEALAVLFCALSIVAPPLGLVGLALLLWLLLAGRRREGQKFAGLRILR